MLLLGWLAQGHLAGVPGSGAAWSRSSAQRCLPRNFLPRLSCFLLDPQRAVPHPPQGGCSVVPGQDGTLSWLPGPGLRPCLPPPLSVGRSHPCWLPCVSPASQQSWGLADTEEGVLGDVHPDGRGQTVAGAPPPETHLLTAGKHVALASQVGQHSEGPGLPGTSSGSSWDDLVRVAALSFPICQSGTFQS